MHHVPADNYSQICQALSEAMHLVPCSALVSDGLGEVCFQEYRRGEQTVGLEWDIWSGFMVAASSTESEPLVQEVADWLSKSEWK